MLYFHVLRQLNQLHTNRPILEYASPAWCLRLMKDVSHSSNPFNDVQPDGSVVADRTLLAICGTSLQTYAFVNFILEDLSLLFA